VDALSYVAVGAASLAAGAINAMAGGGTLVSFPTLVGVGVPAVAANVTNTVALLPGYLAGSYTQRDDLRPQLAPGKGLVVCAMAGGLLGSVLLVLTPESAFRAAVPFLILVSCLLLLAQDRVRQAVNRRSGRMAGGAAGSAEGAAAGPGGPGGAAPAAGAGLRFTVGPALSVLAAATYGGFFGAGLGILLLALLGLFTDQPFSQVNALKQLLSFAANLVAAIFFCFSGHVRWELVPVMGVAALIGGSVGARLSQVIDGTVLRRLVVVAGVAVAIGFWVD
jgi:uncharacterized protein